MSPTPHLLQLEIPKKENNPKTYMMYLDETACDSFTDTSKYFSQFSVISLTMKPKAYPLPTKKQLYFHVI